MVLFAGFEAVRAGASEALRVRAQAALIAAGVPCHCTAPSDPDDPLGLSWDPINLEGWSASLSSRHLASCISSPVSHCVSRFPLMSLHPHKGGVSRLETKLIQPGRISDTMSQWIPSSALGWKSCSRHEALPPTSELGKSEKHAPKARQRVGNCKCHARRCCRIDSVAKLVALS
eukprot:269542-Rhodomonas_salina.1